MKTIKKVICIVLIAIITLALSLNVSKATTLKITTETLNLREKATTDSDIIVLMSEDEECELLDESGDWYKVKYKTYTGYVKKEYTKKKGESSANTTSSEETNTTETSEKTEEKTTETEKADKTENKKSETTSQVTTNETKKIVKDTDIKISPLIGSTAIDQLNKGDEVTIVSVINNWLYVLTNTISGWIRSDSVAGGKIVEPKKVVVSEQGNNTEQKANTENKTENKKQEETKTTNSDTSNKTMYINDEYVNLRKEPSTSSDIVMVVAENTKLTVVGESGDWYKVKTSSGELYVSKELLSSSKVSKSTSRGSKVREENTNKNNEEKSDNKETTTTKTTTKTETTSKSTKSSSSRSNSSKSVKSSSSNAYSSSSKNGNKVVNYAKKFLGVPYVYGGASPSRFDCSGFTMYVFKKFGVSMPHSASAQSRYGKVVNYDKSSSSSIKNNLKPGDLVLFLEYSTMKGIGHCGIYIGNGYFIHASSGSGRCVKINCLLPGDYYNKRFCGARRIVN